MKKSQPFISFVKQASKERLLKKYKEKEYLTRQALAFLQVLFIFPIGTFLDNLPTNSRKTLTVTFCCFIIKTDQWSKISNGNKRSNMEPGEDMKNRANMKKEGI